MKRWIIITMIFFVVTLSGCGEESSENTDDIPNIKEEADTVPPIITLLGSQETVITIGNAYLEKGAIVEDNVDTNLVVTITGTVNTEEYGSYELRYNAVDYSGNQAQEVTRTVIVGNARPSIISSFAYEYYDLVGFSVSVIDFSSSFISANAFLSDGDALIDQKSLENGKNAFEFHNLEEGVDYSFHVTGVFDLGGDLGTHDFMIDPISVGTYRDIDDKWQTELNDDTLFNALKDLVHLPYDTSNTVLTDRMIEQLLKVDRELLIASSHVTDEEIVFVNGYITDAYDNFDLRGIDARGMDVTFDRVPGVCCYPVTVKIGYTGGSVNIVLHEFGHSIDLVLMFGLSMSEEFLEIHNIEKEMIFPGDDYMDYPEEYFAESFGYFYDSETSNNYLLEHAPLTHTYMSTLVDRVAELYGSEFIEQLGE